MHGQPPSGGRVSTVIETPLFLAIPAYSRLFEGEVCLDPCDPFELVTMRDDDGPKVTMLPLGHRLGMQKYLTAVRHIPAVRKYMNSAWGSDQSMSGRGHLSSLGSLPRAAHRPFRTKDGVIRVDAPACAGSAWGVPTPPVSGHPIHDIEGATG